MIECRVTSEQLEAAEQLAKDLGSLKGSITKGTGNLAGFIGELVVADYLGMRQENTYNYDLVMGDRTFDVKTKNTTVEPLSTYEVSVAAYNTKQDADCYVFTRYKAPFTLWILGYLPKEEYYKRARYLKKGTRDGSNGFRVKANCWNVEIKDLYEIGEIIKND